MARRDTVQLTFSRRNQDVKKLLADKKDEDFDFVVTDYLCEAVRFYERYKEAPPSSAPAQATVDVELMKKLIEEKIREMGAVVPADEKAMDIDAELIKKRNLEEDLDDLPIEDD